MAAHPGKSSALGTADLAGVLLKIPFPARMALRLRSTNNFLPLSDGSCLAFSASTVSVQNPRRFNSAHGADQHRQTMAIVIPHVETTQKQAGMALEVCLKKAGTYTYLIASWHTGSTPRTEIYPLQALLELEPNGIKYSLHVPVQTFDLESLEDRVVSLVPKATLAESKRAKVFVSRSVRLSNEPHAARQATLTCQTCYEFYSIAFIQSCVNFVGGSGMRDLSPRPSCAYATVTAFRGSYGLMGKIRAVHSWFIERRSTDSGRALGEEDDASSRCSSMDTENSVQVDQRSLQDHQ
ncbi:hypothetical protein B0H13DRAFT_1868052 [Mycena leptocephala]|nr:hypothetical protein B0H13DRAFT_1868052 [Mycena leptocephala]